MSRNTRCGRDFGGTLLDVSITFSTRSTFFSRSPTTESHYIEYHTDRELLQRFHRLVIVQKSSIVVIGETRFCV
jgi:hypothetical protein